MNSRRFMCGWPLPGMDGPCLARDHLACSTEVACSHVSGLLVQSGWTAGPDGVREPNDTAQGHLAHNLVKRFWFMNSVDLRS